MATSLLLFLLPITNALFGAIVRHAQRRGCRVLLTGASNYITAALLNLGLALVHGPLQPSPQTWQLGIAAGLTYAIAFRVIVTSMGRRGLAVPAAVMQLAVIVPLGCSILLWGERPDLLRVTGTILALLALTLLAADKTAAALAKAGAPGTTRPSEVVPLIHRAPAAVVLVALFILQGGASLAPKAFTELGPPPELHLYLAFLFGTAALTFLPDWLANGPISREDVGWGVLLGLVNAVSNIVAVYVLQRLPGILVFPVITAGSLLITSALGLLVWREPAGRWTRIGMLVALGAVILVNLGR